MAITSRNLRAMRVIFEFQAARMSPRRHRFCKHVGVAFLRKKRQNLRALDLGESALPVWRALLGTRVCASLVLADTEGDSYGPT